MGSWTELVAGLYRLDLLWRQSSVGRSRSANRPRGCTATCCEAWAVPGPSQRGSRGSLQVGRRDKEGGAQVSAGWLFSCAPALLTRELSARVNTRRDVRGVSTERQSQGGAGAPPAMPGRGVQGAEQPPLARVAHRLGTPSPACGQVERGAGRWLGGSRPGGGAGRARRGGAVLCKCRPRAANCLLSARGSERPVPPAASRPEQLRNKPQRSREPRAQRRTRHASRTRAAPRGLRAPVRQPGERSAIRPSPAQSSVA